MTIGETQGSKYSNDQRRVVAIEYLVTGSLSAVSRTTGIPRTTLRDWKRADWWERLVAEVRHEKGAELDAKMSQLIDSAFQEAQDRIENGDYRLDKYGKLVRVPMAGRDLVIAGATVYDKQRLHRNQPTAIRQSSSSLESLAERFRQLSGESRLPRVNSIEGESTEINSD